MSLRMGSVVHDVADLDRAISFWTAALGIGLKHRGDDFAILRGPDVNLSLQLTGEPKPDAWNRVHLDLYADDYEAEAARLAGLGAVAIHREHDADGGHVVMRDPDGNEFCVCG